MSEILSFAAVQVDHEIIVFSSIRQAQRDKDNGIPFSTHIEERVTVTADR